MIEHTANRDAPPVEAARNGPPSLSERVRSLRLPNQPERGGAGWLPWTLCVLLAGSTGYFAWQAFGASVMGATTPENQPAGAQPDAKNATAAGAAPAKAAAEGAIVLESKGYIIPVSLVQVSPKVGGMVMELSIEEGKRVKEGELLAVLERVEYEKDYNRAKGQYEAAEQRFKELTDYREKEIEQVRAEMEDAQSQQRQLELDYQRNVALSRSGAATSRDFELAKFSYESMGQRVKRLELALELMIKGPRDARIAGAKAEMSQTRAEMEKARWKLDNCNVVAPISGTILTKKAERGNQINPAAFSNGLSASLCEMANLSEMEVDLQVPERDIARVFKDQKCRVRAEAFLERGYAGYVSRVMPIANRSQASVPVRVRILIPAEEEGKFLRPEMGALVTFFNEKSGLIGKSAPPPAVGK